MRLSGWSSDVCSSDLERTRRIQGLLSAVRRGARNAAHCVIVVMTAPYLRVVVPCGAVQKQPDPTRSRAKLCHRDTAPVAANRVAVRAENNEIGRASCRERVCQYV